MKCEKQRHQGEENSSKLKREDQPFQPTHTWSWRTGAGGAAPQALRTPPEGRPMARVPLSLPPAGTAQLGPKLLTMPSLIHSFIHSTHLPCTQHRTAGLINGVECTDKCSIWVNYLAQRRDP